MAEMYKIAVGKQERVGVSDSKGDGIEGLLYRTILAARPVNLVSQLA
jgi:hypothetical protein